MHLFAHFSRFCAGFGGFMSKNIAIFASGNGTNAENIIRYFQNSESVNVKLVLADRETAFVLERARRLNIPFACLGKSAWADGTAVLSLLEDKGIDFIVLAGFLARVPDCILHAYPNKIINIHPSLLPKFGGKGMYGGHVHEAVLITFRDIIFCGKKRHAIPDDSQLCMLLSLFLKDSLPVISQIVPDAF